MASLQGISGLPKKICRDHTITKWNLYWEPSGAAMVQTAPDRDFYFTAQRTMNLADEKRWTWRPISHSAASLGPIMRWISIMPPRRCEMDQGGSCYYASRGPSSPLVQIELMEQKSHFDFFSLSPPNWSSGTTKSSRPTTDSGHGWATPSALCIIEA